jgi:SOS-response transcriptional repressor LexA
MEEDMGSVAGGERIPGVSTHAGFPNPAADRQGTPLSLDKLLIARPLSTYLFRIRGHHWADRGIFDGDIALIDRSLDPQEDDTVVWWDENGEFYLTGFKRAEHQNIWGIVTATIHPYKVIL